MSITIVTTFDISLCTGSPRNIKQFKYSLHSSVLRNKYTFSLHMNAKPAFPHRLQTAKMFSSRTSVQNNGPSVQNNDPWVLNNRPCVKRVFLEREMW